MRLTILISIFSLCTSCGYNYSIPSIGHDGKDGSSCSVAQLENGAKISCTDGTFAFIYNGSKGDKGTDGSTCSVFGTPDGASIRCTDGTSNVITNGLNGKSCELTDLANGVLISCEDSQAIVYDGEDAQATTIGVRNYIKPCGDEFPNDEILLRMTDNKIIALYDGGPNLSRLVLLAPGNYATTDRSRNLTCHFTITNNYDIINENAN